MHRTHRERGWHLDRAVRSRDVSLVRSIERPPQRLRAPAPSSSISEQESLTTSSSSLAKAILASGHADADALWSSTEETWREIVPELSDDLLGRRDAEHALAVLRGLTSAHYGMVAAATTSLPERGGSESELRLSLRVDPRPVLCRHPLARHGHFPLLDSAVGFVSERLLADGPALKPAYTVRGGPCRPNGARRTCRVIRAVPTRWETGLISSSSSMHSARRSSCLQRHRHVRPSRCRPLERCRDGGVCD